MDRTPEQQATLDKILADYPNASVTDLPDQGVVAASYKKDHVLGAEIWVIERVYADGQVSVKTLSA